ncbi:hypothetical protein KPATCC21470_8245 [Kitasatospora purpeofusca]
MRHRAAADAAPGCLPAPSANDGGWSYEYRVT